MSKKEKRKRPREVSKANKPVTFKYGLCSCLDDSDTCLVTFFAPCVTFGRIQGKLDDSCFLCGLAYLVPPVNIILHAVARGKIREMKDIPGDTLNDYLMVTCCSCCALMQNLRELEEPDNDMSMSRS